MKNGFHDHFCPQCGHGYICAQITHCSREWKTSCPDHTCDECDGTGQIIYGESDIRDCPICKGAGTYIGDAQ